jgi:uncharacterized protein (TIGR02302 family)
MAPRFKPIRPSARDKILGAPQLKLAQLIVTLENIARIFARPLMVAGIFLALAWLGLFAALYPWLHLAALVLFTVFFFQALGKARAAWRPVSASDAKRRVEEASDLAHRPLDVLEDRPVTLDSDQLHLWQAHVERTRAQIRKLSWPKWKLSFAEHDPYALRFALMIMLFIGLVLGWGVLGGRMIAAINPALGKAQLMMPTLDAWITPPEYTHLPPIMIATPAGMRHEDETIDVPAGSILTAHLAERGGDVPSLIVNDDKTAFMPDDHQDYGAVATIASGKKISVRRGWQTLASWHIRVLADKPPQVAFAEPPSVSESKSVRLSYNASDDYGVTSISVRVTPRENVPGASNDPIILPLATGLAATEVKRVSFEDLTASPWAGFPVQIALEVTDAAGHVAQTDAVDFTLPERVFVNPVARALIDERKKLLQNPDDDMIRTEVANVMAGVAHQPAAYKADPLVMIALRSGAVRLVLDHSHDALASVNELLWQTAVRIEDGDSGTAQQNLRSAQAALEEALDQNASEQEIQKLIDRLHEALAQYMASLSARMAAKQEPMDDMAQLLGAQNHTLTPKDFDNMLSQMRNLSASGQRDAARNELSKMQQLLESLRTDRPSLTEEQKQALERLRGLRNLAVQQKLLLDRTFQDSQASVKAPLPKTAIQKLGDEQADLLKRLQALTEGARKANQLGKSGDGLSHSASAMERAGADIKGNALPQATDHQNEALQALQQAVQSMAESMKSSMILPGMSSGGQGRDPFGRGVSSSGEDGSGQDNNTKIPDQLEVMHVREILDELQRRSGDMGRPKPERDYIDRLLRNF